ncbi:tetratricopeptide repeat protein [Treponema primitia]|uniref:tetratricopeptide repeat protein n=1 Tax=Treponema primitia TaxID=88058 RepID=UPI0002555105|nr:tetratricopeptide repeat protein [Treponema primitia]
MVENRVSEERLKEGIRLFGLKRWEAALQELLRIDTGQCSVEENTELSYYLGLCYMKLERFDDALLYLEQVVTNSEEPLRVYQCRLTLAYVYVITKRAKLAEFELNRLSKSGFESVQIYTTLGYAAWTQKQYKQAVEYYEKAIELDENNATAMNGLGYILADTNMDISRGLRLCRKAVDRAPQNAAYLDSLGWAYYKGGNTQESRVWLRRAYDLSSHNSVIRAHLRLVVGDGS